MKEYICVSDSLPPAGQRVLTVSVFGDDYSWCPGKLTIYGWRDDHSKPIRGVTHWTHVVSPGENA